jgi:hypothetical protein
MNINSNDKQPKEDYWKQSPCIAWPGVLDKDGYPIAWIGGKTTRVARVVLAGNLGREIKFGYYACHNCDKASCVNPAHLFEGTPLDNMRDCIKKGRNARGSKSGNAKLNEYKVVEIREKHSSGIRVKDLADEYNVSTSTISDVVKHETWKHVKAQYRSVDVRFFRLSSFLHNYYKTLLDAFVSEFNNAKALENATEVS